MLILTDGPNWFRRKAETSLKGSPIRECFSEVQVNPNPQIIVWDGTGALAARRKIYPEYKVKRNKPADSFFDNQTAFKKILDLSKATQIEIPGVEADDVIAALVKKCLADGVQRHEIFINSNDGDFAALGVPMARDKFPVKPEFVPLYKSIVGDSGDNIPGIKGFGKQSWEALNEDQMRLLYELVMKPHLFNDQNEIAVRFGDFLGKAVLNWILIKENRELINKFYQIISFMPVDIDTINKHTRSGLNRGDLVEPIFRQLMI